MVKRSSSSVMAAAVVLSGTCAGVGQTFSSLVARPEVQTNAQVRVGAQRPAAQMGGMDASSVLGAVALAAATWNARRRAPKPPHQRGCIAMAARGGDLSFETLVSDLETVMKAKNCGALIIRLAWHDAGVFSNGALKGGCPNAAMRFTDGGEGSFGANAGLPDVALGLLKPITDKYVPALISNADLWQFAANVAIRVMGGPSIKTRFGRKDAASSAESVESQEGRLPDGDKGIDHLRDIFYPKGFDDKAIVALSGAHTVGGCKLERSGFDGYWTEEPLKFDNAYFKDMLSKEYASETTAKGCPQHRNAATGTIMLISDLALLSDPAFKGHVERYAADQSAYFADFSEAWVKLQENGCSDLRDSL